MGCCGVHPGGCKGPHRLGVFRCAVPAVQVAPHNSGPPGAPAELLAGQLAPWLWLVPLGPQGASGLEPGRQARLRRDLNWAHWPGGGDGMVALPMHKPIHMGRAVV